MKLLSISLVAGSLLLAASSASANEFQAPLENLARNEVRSILADPTVISALNAQNGRHQSLDQAAIDDLDKKWRAEVGSGDSGLIADVLSNALSSYLRARKEAAGGRFTEIFVMDSKGLNVGQSDITSDYWQGDEDKWQQTFNGGPDAVHISEVELDESTQTYQSQVSVPIVDPATGKVIGVATFGVDVTTL